MLSWCINVLTTKNECLIKTKSKFHVSTKNKCSRITKKYMPCNNKKCVPRFNNRKCVPHKNKKCLPLINQNRVSSINIKNASKFWSAISKEKLPSSYYSLKNNVSRATKIRTKWLYSVQQSNCKWMTNRKKEKTKSYDNYLYWCIDRMIDIGTLSLPSWPYWWLRALWHSQYR